MSAQDGERASHPSFTHCRARPRAREPAGTSLVRVDPAPTVTLFPRLIGAGSKTGANSVLVAPITLGANVTVGAGSTLTKDVPSGALALGRARQLVREDWRGPA